MERFSENTLLGTKLKCFVCDRVLYSPDEGIKEPVKRWDVNLSNGSYATISTCLTCFLHSDIFPQIMQKVRDSWESEMDVLPWTAEKKKNYRDRFYNLEITGLR